MLVALAASMLPLIVGQQFSKTYVTKMYVNHVDAGKQPAKEDVKLILCTSSLLSRPVETTVTLSDLQRVRPTFFKYVTWKLKNNERTAGAKQKEFFVEEWLLLKSNETKTIVENIK
jgi:hypothetical protein